MKQLSQPLIHALNAPQTSDFLIRCLSFLLFLPWYQTPFNMSDNYILEKSKKLQGAILGQYKQLIKMK